MQPTRLLWAAFLALGVLVEALPTTVLPKVSSPDSHSRSRFTSAVPKTSSPGQLWSTPTKYSGPQPTATFTDQNLPGSTSRTATATTHTKLELSNLQAENVVDSSSAVLFPSSGAWLTIPCDASGLTDNRIPIATRWAAADAQEAFEQALAGFETDLQNPDTKKENELESFDNWIWNAFHYRDAPNCLDYESKHCQTEQCRADGLRPAEYLILDTIAALNTMVRTSKDAIYDSQPFVQNSMKHFTHTFTKLPDKIDIEILKVILDSVTFGIGIGSAFTWNVFLKGASWFARGDNDKFRGMWKDISNGAVAFGMTAGKDSMSNTDEYAQLQDELTGLDSMFLSASINSLSGFLRKTLQGRDKEDRDRLSDMISNGTIYPFLQLTPDPIKSQNTALQLFYGRLIVSAWQISPAKMNPFILRIDRRDYKCGDPVVTPSGMHWDDPGFNIGTLMSPDTARKTQVCDSSGNTWFLLNAVNNDQCKSGNPALCLHREPFFPFQELAGGTSDVLDGNRWGGIKISDIVSSSYGGFLANGGRNGYSMPEDSSLQIDKDWTKVDDGVLPFLDGIATPGFFNFTICLNYKEAQRNAQDGKTPVCGTVPSADGVSPDVNDAGYTPGTCGIHFTQYKPNQGNNNPLDQWQLLVRIFDGARTPLVDATKQPVESGLRIKSALPYDLIVNMEDSKDADSLCFWYSDQYWCIKDSGDHKCNFLDKFDGTYDTRDGDCSFKCDNPTSDPPASATKNLPPSPVTAFTGTGTDYAVAIPVATYKPGWCGLHIRQYQRNEEHNYENPRPDYALELTLFDADKKMIAYADKTNQKSGKIVPIQGPLEWILEAISGTGDSAPVSFKYGAESWDTDSSQCSVGGWQDGMRDIDCGFSC